MSGVLKTNQLKKLKLDKTKLLIAVSLIGFGVLLRLMPHPANFVPIGAIALLGGAILRGKWALIIPVAAMVVSDLVLGLHDVILFTWGAFALIAFLSSRLLAKRLSFESVFFGSLISATLFFLISNFGVWLVTDYYPSNAAGLYDSYVRGLPFFRNTLLGDIVYGMGMYGLYVLAKNYKLTKHQLFNQVKTATK